MEKYNGDQFVSYSAGTDPSRVNPKAIKVMQEKDIDISQNSSKNIDELPEESFDYVITVCDNARENCPYYPALKKLLHHSFEDPPELEKKYETAAEKLQPYRRVRDEIENFIKELPDILKAKESNPL